MRSKRFQLAFPIVGNVRGSYPVIRSARPGPATWITIADLRTRERPLAGALFFYELETDTEPTYSEIIARGTGAKIADYHNRAERARLARGLAEGVKHGEQE